MTTTYILHGGFSRRLNTDNDAFFKTCVDEAGAAASLLLCFFAADDERVGDLFVEMRERFVAAGAVGEFVLATPEQFLVQLATAQFVYFHGGHTPTLLAQLRLAGVTCATFTGKVVAGSSAGAYALAAYGASHSDETVRQGLGCVPVRLICHHRSPDLPPVDASVVTLMAQSTELALQYLADCEHLVFRVS